MASASSCCGRRHAGGFVEFGWRLLHCARTCGRVQERRAGFRGTSADDGGFSAGGAHQRPFEGGCRRACGHPNCGAKCQTSACIHSHQLSQTCRHDRGVIVRGVTQEHSKFCVAQNAGEVARAELSSGPAKPCLHQARRQHGSVYRDHNDRGLLASVDSFRGKLVGQRIDGAKPATPFAVLRGRERLHWLFHRLALRPGHR